MTNALAEQVQGAVRYPMRGWSATRRRGGAAGYLTRAISRDILARRWSFCFVRDPWDWTVSGWLYVTRNEPAYGDAPPDFATFMRGGWEMGLIRNPFPRKFRTARDFVAYHSQRPQERHLAIGLLQRPAPLALHARFERLEEDWARVCERLGREVALPHANRSERAPYVDYYDDETRRIVADRNAGLIARFGYRFGG